MSKDAKAGPRKARNYFWAAGAVGKVRKKETTVSSPALNRAKESISRTLIACEFLESNATTENPSGNRFKAILLQEGLGNLGDGYYYTKEAIQSAVPVFEGKKFYADHPSKLEDEIRPERSVRDVYGHYENLRYQESSDGTGQLVGEVVVLTDGDSDWIRSRLMHAVQFKKKYPDKEFVGLSINAGGDAEPMDIEKFMQEGNITPSAKPKLEQAIKDGLAQVKVVKSIDSAVSCDLVTEAGAKGKVLELLEANKMKDKKAKEAEEKKEALKKEAEKKEADDKAAGAAAGHDDEEKDKGLIMDQLKKHGLVKDGEEADEAMHQAAHKMHQAYKAAGHKGEEAASRAVEAMKCAAAAAGADKADDGDEDDKAKKEAEEKEHKEAADKEEADKKEAEEKKEHKESSSILKLKGENAQLKERLALVETEKYLDKKLQESRLPMAVTKKFRESVKAKSTKDVDEKFNLFMEGYKSFGGEADSLDSCLMTEKETAQSSKGISLDDCVEE